MYRGGLGSSVQLFQHKSEVNCYLYIMYTNLVLDFLLRHLNFIVSQLNTQKWL